VENSQLTQPKEIVDLTVPQWIRKAHHL